MRQTFKTFKTFLSENQYKTKISDEQVIDLLKTKCSDAMKHGKNTPIIRGMTESESSLLIQGSNGNRKSANTTNYYTIILDHTLSQLGYPKRSKSIICGNLKNIGYVNDFGEKFAIIPYDGVKIGVCPSFDMWSTKFKSGPTKIIDETIENLNFIYKMSGIPETSYIDIIDAIEKITSGEFTGDLKQQEYQSLIASYFEKGEVKHQLETAYSESSLDFSLETTKTIYNIEGKRELWIGGKCLAIPLDNYTSFIKKYDDI